jgi:hypothetical protein
MSAERKLWTFTDGVANRSSRTSEPGTRAACARVDLLPPQRPGALKWSGRRRDRPLAGAALSRNGDEAVCG